MVVPIGWYSLRLAAAPGTNDVTSHSPVGEIKRLAQTAAGRIMLAAMTADEVDQYLAWSADQPAAPDRADLVATLARIRESGFAREPTSYAPGRCSAALPVRREQTVIGAVAVEGPVLEADEGDEQARLQGWLAALAPLEKAINHAPHDIAGPFFHLPRDQIVLAVDAD